MKVVAVIAALVVAVVFTFCGYVWWGNSWEAIVAVKVMMSKTEDHAAYGSKRFPEDATRTELLAGERVAVLWDTYGKDYWACYVRDSVGRRGWVKCVALNKSSS